MIRNKAMLAHIFRHVERLHTSITITPIRIDLVHTVPLQPVDTTAIDRDELHNDHICTSRLRGFGCFAAWRCPVASDDARWLSQDGSTQQLVEAL